MNGEAPPRVPAAVLAILAASLALMPLLRPSGPGNSSPVDVLIGLSIVAVLLWSALSALPLHLPYAVPAAVLLAAGAIAGLAGPFPGLSLLQLGQDLFLFAWCAAIVNAARSPAAFRLLLGAWAWGAIGWALLLVGAYAAGNQALAGVTDREGARASLLVGDPNLAATYFVVSLLVVAASGTPSRRLLRVPAYLVLAAAVGLTGSNGGMLALAVSVVVAVAVGAARRYGLLPTAAVAALLLVAGAGVASRVDPAEVQQLARDSGQPLLRDSIGRSDASLEQRQTLLQESEVLFYEGAPLGIGPRSTKSVLAAQQAPYAKEAHDDYVAALVERGLLGGAGLLLFIVAIGLRARSLLRGRAAPAFARAPAHTAPVLGALAGVAVFATNEQVLHFRHVWALLAVVAAYHLWAAPAEAARERAAPERTWSPAR
jgi:O-antigen ligase